ncbi:MAG: MbnP family protein [Flavobacteriales bacterium]
MMRSRPTFRPFLCIALVVAVVGCREDEPIPPSTPVATNGTLRVRMLPEWEGQPLAFYTEHRNVSDYRTTVELLKIYLGDVDLLGSGADVRVKDVEFFDLANGGDTVEWSVPAGTYSGLHAGLGVPPTINHSDPTLYGEGHPLSVSNGTHWGWAGGYRFVSFEGRYDPDPQSTAPLVTAFTLHTGPDTCYTALQLMTAQPIVITAGSTTELTIRVAVDRFYTDGTTTLDLATENTLHGNDIPLALKCTRHMAASITVD